MSTRSVPVRELRNRGGRVLDEVARGESVVITRDGAAVAELRPLPRRGLTATELIARRRRLPSVDVAALRSDIDSALDMDL